jgi:hypothetical protein
VRCPKGHTNEEWDAMSIEDSGVRYQRTKGEGEHEENRPDLVPENNCCRVDAVYDVIISVLVSVGSAGKNRTHKN